MAYIGPITATAGPSPIPPPEEYPFSMVQELLGRCELYKMYYFSINVDYCILRKVANSKWDIVHLTTKTFLADTEITVHSDNKDPISVREATESERNHFIACWYADHYIDPLVLHIMEDENDLANRLRWKVWEQAGYFGTIL